MKIEDFINKWLRNKSTIDNAFAVGNYDYVFPNGKNIIGDVAEVWKARDGKLDSLTIFWHPGFALVGFPAFFTN